MIGQHTETGRADDIIDALLARTHGNVLAPPSTVRNGGGEYDAWCDLNRRDVRRLVAAGLLRRGGMQADRLAHECDWQGNADEFVAWYVSEALRGLDARAELRAGDAWADRERPDDDESFDAGNETGDGIQHAPTLPEPLCAYLRRLQYDRKRQYAAAVILAMHDGSPIPTCAAEWAPRVVSKVIRYYRKAPR